MASPVNGSVLDLFGNIQVGELNNIVVLNLLLTEHLLSVFIHGQIREVVVGKGSSVVLFIEDFNSRIGLDPVQVSLKELLLSQVGLTVLGDPLHESSGIEGGSGGDNSSESERFHL